MQAIFGCHTLIQLKTLFETQTKNQIIFNTINLETYSNRILIIIKNKAYKQNSK